MNVIWKYEIAVVGKSTIKAPEDAWFLTGQMQGDNLCVWAIVDTKAPMVEKDIVVVATGEIFDATKHEYIATIQVPFGFVWHIFGVL